MLVLEAGTTQISAFDLNGNPVRYFGTGPDADRKFTRDLVSKGTPLDLAVDGAGQIYVLYFTGTGSAPVDYHVDVYTKSGDVLDTHSPGVNVAASRSTTGAASSAPTTTRSPTSGPTPRVSTCACWSRNRR